MGQALARRKQGGGHAGGAGEGKHTTETNNMQSVLDRNDLDELMAMADLADRDFTAERYQPVVLSMYGAHEAPPQITEEERAAAEAQFGSALQVPRRPHWDASTTPDQLDQQERQAFLDWRRRLAQLEDEEGLVLTPFERNLEVWRQLWRVLERSDVVVQVVDARDPLTYWSDSLAAYASDIHPTKASVVLLNKADLLPAAVREGWADWLEARGRRYAFWSAAAASEAQQAARHEASALGLPAPAPAAEVRNAVGKGAAGRGGKGGGADEEGYDRIRVLDVEELLEVLEAAAREAVEAADEDDPRRSDPDRRLVVGLVGYPNVGKSSTINAIFGAKKTAVAPTPGKTKHFQTLNVSPTLCLCDCPGLVLPRFAGARAEMVAAGVVPIDRLTDFRAPVDVVARRCGRRQLQSCYGLRLPPADPPRAQQLLVALAAARGWVAGGGLPDEARAGRTILKDYTAGRLVYCQLPPGSDPPGWAPHVAPEKAPDLESMPLAQPAPQPPAAAGGPDGAAAAAEADIAAAGAAGASSSGAGGGGGGRGAAAAAAAPQVVASAAAAAAATAAAAAEDLGDDALLLDEADLELLDGLSLEGGGGASKKVPVVQKPRPQRPDYKMQKKGARSKGARGVAKDDGDYDGAALAVGKKGGLLRVTGYAQTAE